MKLSEKYGLEFHHVIGDGWVHSHGMDQFGFPEVEARGVADYLAPSAGRILREVCDYMLENGVGVKAGETMELSPSIQFRFVKGTPLPGEENHYEVERLRLADIARGCGCCGLAECDQD